MKTISLINKYKKLLEQTEDVVEAPDATNIAEMPSSEEPTSLTPEAEKNYINLLFRAFMHDANENEKKTVNEFKLEYGDSNPKMIAEVMSKYLEGDSLALQSMLAKA